MLTNNLICSSVGAWESWALGLGGSGLGAWAVGVGRSDWGLGRSALGGWVLGVRKGGFVCRCR